MSAAKKSSSAIREVDWLVYGLKNNHDMSWDDIAAIVTTKKYLSKGGKAFTSRDLKTSWPEIKERVEAAMEAGAAMPKKVADILKRLASKHLPQ